VRQDGENEGKAIKYSLRKAGAIMRYWLLVACSAVALGGCKSPEEKIVDLRIDLRTRVDGLYAKYGGGMITNLAKLAGEPAAPVAAVLEQVDRSHFESYCVAVGLGERPFQVSASLDTFMREQEHMDACRRVAELQRQLQQAEAQMTRSQPRQ
jgi:hypothetical protein